MINICYIMKHIIDKLLLISSIKLVDDIVGVIKNIYINCSFVIILPPTDEQYYEHYIKKSIVLPRYAYVDNNGFIFCNVRSVMKNTQLKLFTSGDIYQIYYRRAKYTLSLDFVDCHINNNYIWYNRKLIDSCYCSDEIVPLYYFPPN